MRAAKFFPATIVGGALTALLVGAPSAHAQRTQASVDVGGVALRYADTVNAGAAAVSPHALLSWGSSQTEAFGTFSQFLPGGWSAQGGLSGSYFSPLRSRLIGEIGGFAGGSTHNNGARTGEILGNLRLHYEVGTGEIFGGAGAGETSFGNGSQSIFIGEMGLSTRLGEIDATLTASPIAVDSIRYTDTQLALSWTRRSIVFDALFGFRLGDQLTDLGATARTWGSLSAIAWLTPHIAGVLSGGTYPIDPTQGFPGGRFLSASIRLARGNDRPDIEVKDPGPLAGGTLDNGTAIEQFAWEKSGAADVILRALAPGAQSVDVTGDFTKWSPLQLSRENGGWWTITLPSLFPGKYQLNLRVNGGNWIVPPGLLSMADEFGGAVGLLVVE
ncbi:MAG TPA: glycogen-binding domain-containing protein [Gemmatimonadaceae bacterium]|nr:glycogen-binding domain-containing protein [Gemmatimonadaceae bacterium]